jgi:hypothetical protein
MDRSAALRPLTAAAGPIRELREYDTDARLNAAVAAVADAVEQSLRLALNTDGSAPEDHRLSALSSNALSLEQVLQSLRARDRIALETAGSVHALDAAGDRARAGHARDSDADLAADAVTRLRADLASDPTPDPEAAGTGAAPAVGEDRSGTAPMPAPSASPSARLRGRRRSMAWVGSGLALLFLIGLAWVLSSGGGGPLPGGSCRVSLRALGLGSCVVRTGRPGPSGGCDRHAVPGPVLPPTGAIGRSGRRSSGRGARGTPGR